MPSWNPALPSFGDAYPELVHEWSWLENPDFDPYSIAPNSNRKVVWRCLAHGHRQVKEVSKKIQYKTCGICTGKIVLRGFNDLATVRPDIAQHWDYLLNAGTPESVTAGSGKKVMWRCHKEAHSYSMSPTERCLADYRCPYCCGSRTMPGFNDLASVEPKLAAEWDYQRNELLPTEVTRSSAKQVHWICPEGHPYFARIADRVHKSSGCSICTNKAVLAGVNDLQALFPEIAAELHPDNPFGADQVVSGSNIRAKWLCSSCSHVWHTQVQERTGPHKTGCPHCNGREPIIGLDDFETLFPHIALEWDKERNGDLLPSQVLPLSNRYVYWLCEKGHSVRTQVSSRVRHWGCRKCSSSRIEKDLAKGLAKYPAVTLLEHAHPLPVAWRSQRAAIVDIYLELASGLQVVIEYDGVWWHREKQEMDTAKTQALVDSGYTVIRVREHDLSHLTMKHPRLHQFNHGTRKQTQPELLIPKVEALLASL